MLSNEEHALLSGLTKGDDRSFRLVFDTYYSRLFALSFQMTRDSAKAKDAVQEVFIKLWNSRAKIVVNTSLEAYLKRAVINTTLNAIEKDKRHSFMSVFHPESSASIENRAAEDVQEASELQQAIDKAILSLPARTRAVFILVRLEEMSYDQVSDSLNISNKAVEKEMMKALRLLRRQLRSCLSLTLIPALAIIFN